MNPFFVITIRTFVVSEQSREGEVEEEEVTADQPEAEAGPTQKTEDAYNSDSDSDSSDDEP
jgi:hypothetical protein